MTVEAHMTPALATSRCPGYPAADGCGSEAQPGRARIIIPREEPRHVAGGRAWIPVARIVRDDGRPRTHHRRCPTYPGEQLDEHTICCDCIYGALAEREM